MYRYSFHFPTDSSRNLFISASHIISSDIKQIGFFPMLAVTYTIRLFLRLHISKFWLCSAHIRQCRFNLKVEEAIISPQGSSDQEPPRSTANNLMSQKKLELNQSTVLHFWHFRAVPRYLYKMQLLTKCCIFEFVPLFAFSRGGQKELAPIEFDACSALIFFKMFWIIPASTSVIRLRARENVRAPRTHTHIHSHVRRICWICCSKKH